MRAAREIANPRPGAFRLRLVRGGWAVPCRIAHDEPSGLWSCTIDGVTMTHADAVAAGVFKVWIYGQEVEEWVVRDLEALKVWARTYQPDHPCLHPRRRMDPNLLAPVRVPESFLRR
jgi:hypothetical protein